jgi:tRNA nucleotidyltransferase (CCA-adding enzyme)
VTKISALVKAANSLESLGLSKAEQRFSVNLLRYLPQFKQLVGQEVSPQAQYQLFRATMTTFPALVALAIADGIEMNLVIPWLQRWLDPQDAIAHPAVLITGDDLRNRLNLAPSPQIGELLEQVRLAQVAGIIFDAEGAIAYITKLLEKSN